VIARTPKGIRLYTGNDGGFFRQDSHAISAGRDGFEQRAWTDMNRLASVQAWHVARKPDGEYLTGLQDNGGGFFKAGGTNKLVSSGDGLFVFATADPNTWYMSAQGAVLYVTRDHGKTIREIQPDLAGAGFLSPIAIDPTDANHLVAAGNDVQETTKGPNTMTVLDPVAYTVVKTDWTSSYTAGNSPYVDAANKPIPYTSYGIDVRGAAVYAGMCALCRNSLGDPKLIHSTVVTNVGKPGCTPKKASKDCWHTAKGAGLPHVGINNVAIDPQNVRTVYVALNEYSLVGLDQKVVGGQRVMVSHDAGEHFTDLTGNLPRTNVRDVVVRNGQLIVATDFGVFTAPRSGGRWSRLASGLPPVRIFDLSLDAPGRHLTVSAYGRGVWDLDFGAKAVSSSAGPGTGVQQPAPPTPQKAGGGFPTISLGTPLPWQALLALLVVPVLRRRRLGRIAAAQPRVT